MKKTLIALAAVAVSSAAMAQVTISGAVGFSYESNKSAVGAKTSGFSNTDGNIGIRATEDLGNGTTASAFLSIQNAGRQAAAASRDVTLTVNGAFGTVSTGQVENASPLANVAGGPVRGLDVSAASGFSLATGATLNSVIGYTSPAFSGVRVSVAKLDEADKSADTKANTKPATVYGLSYAAGPLTVGADLTQMSVENNANYKSRTRLTARYNAGVAVIGVGYQTFDNRTTAAEPKTTAIGVSVPMGAITLGAQQSTQKTAGAASNKGTAIGVKYALSKRTDITLFNVSTKEGTNAAAKATRVRLLHTF
jgi:predicted porin